MAARLTAKQAEALRAIAASLLSRARVSNTTDLAATPPTIYWQTARALVDAGLARPVRTVLSGEWVETTFSGRDWAARDRIGS